MKRIFPLILVSLLIITSCGRSKKESKTEENKSKIEFENTTFDFGNIAIGSDGTCDFRFTNTSDEDLIINTVKTSCGCTNPEWPKDPIKPGNTGEIKVKYNTKIQGKFQKSITVFCNASNSPAKLLIKGEVQPDSTVVSSSSKK
jgi:hypothetical protein